VRAWAEYGVGGGLDSEVYNVKNVHYELLIYSSMLVSVASR
jgi:hypothetical protein